MHQIRFKESTGVAHIRIDGPDTLVHVIGRFASPAETLRFGAVYVDGRRATVDQALATGQLIRLHTRPKRYPVPTEPLKLVLDHEEFVVLDKPSGLPTHPTLDNVFENAAHALGSQLGYPLYVTHRLDIPTAGLLILAKTPAAQALINKGFAKNRVEKYYRAYAAARVAPGAYRHFIDPATRVPRAITSDARAGWWECRLVVEDAGEAPEGWRHDVRLLTGKTHQIRAQFAALGAPLIGDELYGGPPAARFGLVCARLVFPFRTDRIDVRREW